MQQSVRFENRKKLSLSGVLHLPDSTEPLAYALYAHCFTCTNRVRSTDSSSTCRRYGGIGQAVGRL